MLSYEDFVDAARRITDTTELGEFLAKDAGDEGYENLVFATLRDNRQVEKLPWMMMPEGYGDAYISLDFKSVDPVLEFAERVQGHFFWSEVDLGRRYNALEIDVVNQCRDLNVHSGTSLSIHKPDGSFDLIGVSKRHNDRLDLLRTAVLREKISFVHRCYEDLIADRGHVAREAAFKDYAHQHAPPGMTLARCRALVFVDMAATRWRLGLPELNIKLKEFISDSDLNYLISWGLIHEVPDESHFYYILVPTVLGKNHVRLCAHVPELRRSLWEAEVTLGRLPSLE